YFQVARLNAAAAFQQPQRITGNDGQGRWRQLAVQQVQSSVSVCCALFRPGGRPHSGRAEGREGRSAYLIPIGQTDEHFSTAEVFGKRGAYALPSSLRQECGEFAVIPLGVPFHTRTGQFSG